MKSTAITLWALTLLAACAAAPDKNASIDVYKHDGSRQCEGEGMSPQDMQSQLGGIKVYAARKGQLQGVAFPAVCGGGTPHINVYTIDASQREQAEQRGFAVIQPEP